MRLPNNFRCVWLAQEDDKTACFALRTEVFMIEQKFKDEFDQIDDTAQHVLLLKDNLPVATARIFFEHGCWWIGRICVKDYLRGQHIGKLVLSICEKEVVRLGGSSSFLKAQMHAKGFYKLSGYIPQGQTFYEEHCEHVLMKKQLC